METTTKEFENNAAVNFELFKAGERIEFEGIIELQADNDNPKKIKQVNLSFFHRIPNIQAIRKLNINILKNAKNFLLYGIMILGLGISFSRSTLFNIYPWDLEIYKSSDNSLIQDNDLKLSSSFDSIVTNLQNNSNVLMLIIKRSNIYTVHYDKIDFKNSSVGKFSERIYVKRKITFTTIAFLILLIISILLSLFYFYRYFYLLTKKKYLKYIE